MNNIAFRIIADAVKAVPAVKYAIGIAGIVSLISVIASLNIDFRIALFGSILMLFMMTVLLIFAKLSTMPLKNLVLPMITFTWLSLLLTATTAVFLMTSVFFKWPIDLQHWISEPVTNTLSVKQASKKIIPFNTGWIFIGYYENEKKVYIEGPFANVVFSPIIKRSGAIVPEIGDILQIRKVRRVIIAKFKSNNLKYQLISPPKIHGILKDDDETGIILKKGLLVIVRDVTITHFPDRPYAIWCRVAECDSETESCRKARLELAGDS